jgi:hypothetical protein
VESGLMAAQTLLDAAGDYCLNRLSAYATDLDQRFTGRRHTSWLTHVPPWLIAAGGSVLLRSSTLTRTWLLDRAFLHRDRPPLVQPAQPLHSAAGG